MTIEDEKVVEGCEKWSQLAAWSHVSISAQIAAASRIIRYDDDCHDYEDEDDDDEDDDDDDINPTHQLTINAALVVDE